MYKYIFINVVPKIFLIITLLLHIHNLFKFFIFETVFILALK